MGVISRDKIDVFVSYGRDDNRAFGQRVKEFHDALKEKFEPRLRLRSDKYPALRQLQGRPEFFWDDTGFPPNGDPSAELLEKVKSSQFLFIFVGEAYLKSPWCGKELDGFFDAVGRDREELVRRLFIVVLSRDAKERRWHPLLEQDNNRPIFHELYTDDDTPIRRYVGGGGFLNDRYEPGFPR